MKTYTAWGADGVASTLHEGEDRPCFADGTPNEDCPELIWRIEASDWHDAMRQYHELQGWEPYEPPEGDASPSAAPPPS